MSALGSLVRVDRLIITFLVDNTIEWFGKLPPGFKNELRNQLSNEPPVDPKTGAPIIDLENFCCGAHGFSALIETTVHDVTHTLLFDTGPDSKSIIRNVHALKAEEKIKALERVVLSHWHKDHSGGLLSLLELRNSLSPDVPVTVDLHPDRPFARGIAPPPTYATVIGRLPDDPTFEEVALRKGIVEKNSEGHLVAGGTVFVSGEIPRITDFESGGLLGSVRWHEDDGASSGKWKPEPHIMDERYAAIDVKGKGLVIFTACSHAGVINVVRDSIQQFKRPIHMIVGGLHLGGPELYDRIEPTVQFLSQRIRPAPTYVLPMHCSGFPVKVALQRELGEGCIPAGTGMVCEIVAGSQELDERLSVSIK